jgi:hypothetical protein
MTTQNIKHPETDDHQVFIGRRALVNKIYARIGAGRPQSVSIVGDTRIGKSSLLTFLAHEETRKQYLSNPDDYIYLYIPCRNIQPVTLENFTRILFSLSEPYATSREESGHNKFNYNYYKHLVESLHKQGKKIILFLDDFNLITLNPAFPLEFFSFLRSLANNYNIAYVTTSYEDLQKLCVSKDIEESPFFNIFTNMSLKGFEDAELEQFFDQICPNGYSDNPGFRTYLTDLAGRFPYPLQVACDKLNDATGEMVYRNPEAEKQLFEELQDHFQIVWERLEDAHREMLKMIVSEKRVPDVQQYLLRDLSKKNYIILNGQTGAKIDGKLFRHFVARRAGLATMSGEAGKPDGGVLKWFRRLLGIKT